MTIIFNTKLGEITGVTSSSKIQITVFKSSLGACTSILGTLGISGIRLNRQPPNLWVNMSMFNLMLTIE